MGIAKQRRGLSQVGPSKASLLCTHPDLSFTNGREGVMRPRKAAALQGVNSSAVHRNPGSTACVFKEKEALYFPGQKRMLRVCAVYTSRGFNQQAVALTSRPTQLLLTHLDGVSQ